MNRPHIVVRSPKRKKPLSTYPINPNGYDDLRSFKKRKLPNYSRRQLYHFGMEAVCSNDAKRFICLAKSGLYKYDKVEFFGSIASMFPKDAHSNEHTNHLWYNSNESIQHAAMFSDNAEILQYMVKTKFIYGVHSYDELPEVLKMLFHLDKYNTANAIITHNHIDSQILWCMPTIMSLAAAVGKKEYVLELLSKGANVDGHPWEDDEGYINYATFYMTEDRNGVYSEIVLSRYLSTEEKIEMMNFMFSKGANPNGFTTYLNPPFCNAASVDAKLLDWFVQKGIDIAPKGYGPHYEAIQNDRSDVLQYLVDKGISITGPVYSNVSPFEYAARCKAADCFEVLRQQLTDLAVLDLDQYLITSFREDRRNVNRDELDEYDQKDYDFQHYILSLGASEDCLNDLVKNIEQIREIHPNYRIP